MRPDPQTVPPLIAVAGNPNTGKSTVFNRLTGSRTKTGNYPGVTVDRTSGPLDLIGAGRVEVVDIPGTYSLVARSGEEEVALQAILGLKSLDRPNVVVVCVDATNLQRNLYLVLQLQELGVPLVIALTMTDECGPHGPSAKALAAILHCPVVPLVAHRGLGIVGLKTAIDECIAAPVPEPRWRWTPSPDLQRVMDACKPHLPQDGPEADAFALWALQSLDPEAELTGFPRELWDTVDRVVKDGAALDDEVVLGRYGWLDEHVAPLIAGSNGRNWTQKVDRWLIHPVWGFGVFLAIMFLVFQSLFAWADPLISAVEIAFGWLGDTARASLPSGLVTDFVVEGLIGGVGSVLVFLPQILLLFLFLGIMEDSGYLARVAYLMDRIMKAMNLHGRAFVPMLSGVSCAIPAIMATRTMERRRDRILTMMVVPLMTCAARLPVYTLVIAALFPATRLLGIFPVQGLLMVGMYTFSVIVALVVAWVLSRSMLKAPPVPFLMELPPYRRPQLSTTARMMADRSALFVREAGSMILVATVVLWVALSFPKDVELSRDYGELIASATPELVAELEQERDGELLRASWGGRVGQWVEPALAPLGFDWKIGVGLIGAMAAREVFISTMGIVYNLGSDVDEESATLREKIRAEVHEDGRRVYTPRVGLSLLVFFAIACQCVSTLAVVKRETGGWKWPSILFAYTAVLAWVSSFAVYQIGGLLGMA